MNTDESREGAASATSAVDHPGPSETTPLLSVSPSQWKVHVSNRTARMRLQPFIDKAIAQQSYQYRLSKLIKYGINFIILLQVCVGAAITIGAILQPSEWTRLATASLGSLGTISAAILARAKLKGTNQPEIAETHCRDLERFLGQCELFVDDVGPATGPEIDAQVTEFVRQFDAIEDKAAQAARGRETQSSTSPA